jgi:hypothetical protein
MVKVSNAKQKHLKSIVDLLNACAIELIEDLKK